jgi:hypothetical protein
MLQFAFILLQVVISVKPGFIDLAEGNTNVRKYEHVSAGKSVQTGPKGFVEMALGLDSLLRLDENSSAVLESFDTTNVFVRIESGAALLEVADIDKGHRIHITFSKVKALIDSKGVFRFSGNAVSVIEGRLKLDDASTVVQKDSQVTNVDGNYLQSRLVFNTPPAMKSFMSSPKAGFVNAVHGEADVRQSEIARQDQRITTGTGSYVELLLHPGAFMRVDENSTAVIESASINDVVVGVLSGGALIENVVAGENLPIRLNVGGSKVLIVSPGLYRLTKDTASVIDGLLRVGQKDDAASPGKEVQIADKQYQIKDLPEDPAPTGLDLWSKERSHLLRRANLMADYGDSDPNFSLLLNPTSNSAAWMYSPSLMGLTFVPQLKRQSPYGNSFVPLYTLVPSVPIAPRPPVRLPTVQPSPVTPAPTSPPTSTRSDR